MLNAVRLKVVTEKVIFIFWGQYAFFDICNEAIEGGVKLFANTCNSLMGIFFHFGFKIVPFSMVLFVHLVSTI